MLMLLTNLSILCFNSFWFVKLKSIWKCEWNLNPSTVTLLNDWLQSFLTSCKCRLQTSHILCFLLSVSQLITAPTWLTGGLTLWKRQNFGSFQITFSTETAGLIHLKTHHETHLNIIQNGFSAHLKHWLGIVVHRQDVGDTVFGQTVSVFRICDKKESNVMHFYPCHPKR